MSNVRNSNPSEFIGMVRQCFAEDKLLNALVFTLSFLCVLLAVIAIVITFASIFGASSIIALGMGSITALPWLVVALAIFLYVRRYIAK